MERRINKKIEEHHNDFVDKLKAITNNIKDPNELMEKISSIIKETAPCLIGKQDFVKRKRVKNTVDLADRCCACRANGEQCTRRRKDASQFCGTHIKGTPNGITHENPHTNQIQTKKEVWAQEISGIIYYLDQENNVYKAEDIMSNKVNPEIIYKWSLNSDNSYQIIQT